MNANRSYELVHVAIMYDDAAENGCWSLLCLARIVPSCRPSVTDPRNEYIAENLARAKAEQPLADERAVREKLAATWTALSPDEKGPYVCTLHAINMLPPVSLPH